MSEWQPIETAPRDGQLILLWTPGTWETWSEFDLAYWKRTGFVLKHDSHYQVGRATHWMPLLAPAKKSTETAPASTQSTT